MRPDLLRNPSRCTHRVVGEVIDGGVEEKLLPDDRHPAAEERSLLPPRSLPVHPWAGRRGVRPNTAEGTARSLKGVAEENVPNGGHHPVEEAA